MRFIGWIEIDKRMFSVNRIGTSFVVQKYMDGMKVDDAKCVYSLEEFDLFINELPSPKNKFKLEYEF